MEYNELLEVAETQNKNISLLTEGIEVLAGKVESRPTKRAVNRIVAIVAAIVLSLSLSLNYAGFSSSRDAVNEIKSCTTPSGECAQQGAESQGEAIGSIVCNQEKVVYFLEHEDYIPLPMCAEFINFEIERIGVDDYVPHIEVDPTVTQYGLHKSQ